MDEYISKHEAYTMMKDLEATYIYPPVKEAYGKAARRIDQMPSTDVQPVNQWISVEEKVPDVSGNYLCYSADGEFDVLYFDREIEDDEYNSDYPFGVWNIYPSKDGGECREWIEVLEVTHWQPLPEPPKDGDADA